MPRVLIITFSLLPAIGGAEIYVCKLSQELAAKGYDVTVICRDWSDSGQDLDRVKLLKVKVPNNSWARATFNVFAIRKALATLTRADIVNVHDPFHFLPLGLLHQLAGSRTIVTSHGVTFDNPRDPFTQNLIFYHSAKTATLLANAIVANDLHFVWWCSLWGIPHEKVFYVPNGVDIDQFRPNPIPHEQLNVLVPRNLVEGRGVQVVVSAVAQAKDRIPPGTRFYVVGDGPLRGQLKTTVSTLGLSERFSFLGRVDHERMSYWYNRSDIVLVPTLWSEGTSLAALEAMACGVPVIASRVGGLPDIVDNTVGRVVAPGDPAELAKVLLELLSDANLRLGLGRRARARVAERFTLSQWITRTMGVFERTLQQNTSAN